MFSDRHTLMVPLLAVFSMFMFLATPVSQAASLLLEAREPQEIVRLPNHVLPTLRTAMPLEPTPGGETELLMLTVVLRRADQAGFDRYLHDVHDPRSPQFRHFLSPGEVSARFGPTPETYDAVLAYLQDSGFTLMQGSANRLTLTVSGTRAQAERAFDVHIRDFDAGGRRFFANDKDPAVPLHLSTRLQGVIGLSDLGRPRPAADALIEALYNSLMSGSGMAFKLLALRTPQAIAAAAADPAADPRLLDLLRRAGDATRLLIALQSALALASPPKPLGK